MKKNRIIIIIAIVIVLLLIAVYWLLNTRGQTDIVISEDVQRVDIYSSAFENGGVIPIDYTGDGEDISPDLEIENLSEDAVSIAIIMEDLDVPWKSNFTHWVIWNIPPLTTIPEATEHGGSVSALEGAIQGVAYGKNCYRGPDPPIGSHRYQFHVFVLDCELDLDSSAGKDGLTYAMEDHIIQYGSIIGCYPKEVD